MNPASWKWVFVGGMIRSGSTVQYQIAKRLVEENLGGTAVGFLDVAEIDQRLDVLEAEPSTRFPCVVKSHVCTPGIASRIGRGDAIAFYTYRDIRDVVVSGCRNFGISLESFLSGRLIDQTIGEGYLWTSSPTVHASSFESLMADMPSWIAGMAERMGIADLPRERFEEIAAAHSLERQRERIGKADHVDLHGYSVDPETLLHKNHIGEAAVGGWREKLAPAQVRKIEEMAGDWMADHGYSPAEAGAAEKPTERERNLRRRTASYFQESDVILQEREALLKKLSQESSDLSSRLGEAEQALVDLRSRLRSPSAILAMIYRAIVRKLFRNTDSAT